jgi:recombination protein RecA
MPKNPTEKLEKLEKVEKVSKVEKKKPSPIEIAIANMTKHMGDKKEDPVIYRYGDKKGSFVQYGSISFGLSEVDKASNCGGVPRGKVIEIFGPESGGKSYLSLKLMASAQKLKLNALLVDAENSFDPMWAAKRGVNVDDLYLINEPMTAEKTLDYVYAVCKSGQFGLVVVDSTAALVPKVQLEGSTEDQNYALLARAMSNSLSKIVQACGTTKTTCVFLNQIREKMNVMFGDNETTPGGRALKFYSHQRIRVIPSTLIKDENDVVIARKSYVKFVKNKVAAPFGECQTEIVFNEVAFNSVVRLCNLARIYGVITTYKGEYRLDKVVMETAKNVETGCMKIVDLADYLVKEGLVAKILLATIEEHDIKPNEKVKNIPDEVLAMLENPDLIVSPKGLGDQKDVEVTEKLSESEDLLKEEALVIPPIKDEDEA